MGRRPKEVPIRKVEVTCRYCEQFVESQIIFRKGQTDDQNVKLRVNRRWCTPSAKLVDINEPVCSRFIPSNSFYCRNNSIWLDILVCGYRRTKESKECKGCSQAAEILELRRLIHRRLTVPKVDETVIEKRDIPRKEEPKRVIKRFNFS